MKSARRVRLFRYGRSQAVRIPRAFELPGEEAIMRHEGDRLIIEPIAPNPLLDLLDLLDSWASIDERLPEVDDPPPESIDL